ncbi:cytochrome P450 [Calothrix parasitica NIES-267]|uniref:Cytochrome P450 n=1 Tax=Calothrix parasitica NIES-267 TaxID=1973488 RepID=A0A1Z4M0V8_9CYAN|nr:cytochrome P450 [Calothrix parasitica NIES-267]
MTKLTVPGPQPLPLVGRNILVSKFVRDSLGFTNQLFQEYGKLVSLARGGRTNLYSPVPNCPGTVFTYGAENIQKVTTNHEIYYKYPLTGGLYSRKDESPRTEPLKHFGVGLFGVNSDEHRRHRQLLMPAFHQKRIESYRDTFVEITESVSQEIEVNQVTDIAKLMRLLTLRIATKTLFGADIGEKGSKSAELLKQIGILLGNPTTMVLPFDLPGFPFHRMMTLMAELDEDMREIIRSRQATDIDTGDVLSMLIKARDAETGMTLTEDELLGHVSVIFAAGHETSANALTWTLFLLSQHPEIAADLLDELDTVLKGEPPTVEQLQQLPLLERVIKESMRILTPVPWNARATSQATTLEGYELPTGTEVWVSIFHTHRNPEIYPEPLKFNPQRWETLEVDNFQYNPFSAGSRKCIGAGFAMMEIKIVLAMLLQKFRFQCLPQQKITYKALIVLAPKGGLPMLVSQQDRDFHQGVGEVKGNIGELVELG